MLSLNQTQNKKAIAYYRHSAEDKQENSVLIQREHAQKFAAQYQIEIIHEEADEGKSGLLSNRPGFEKLFSEWILKSDAPQFDYVLVYDVSRWGRFQDQDEAAYYEFRCKQQGKKVVYVSRGFPKEEQKLISHLQTSIERYMAAEYSRQLSDKVFHGCVKVSEQGYSAGGTPCYGMARLLLDESKKPVGILKKGEHKAIDNQRVTFTPMNDETTKTVQDIFELLVKKWFRPNEIAEVLNHKNIPSAKGGKWDSGKVFKILTNETYTGTRIYNKTWGRLKQKKQNNPRNEWVIKPDAFPPVVDQEIFKEAQEHLYWIMPSKWKKGIHLINTIAKFFHQEIIGLLIKKGLSEDETALAIKKFPISFSINFYRDSTPHWCFIIPEEMRNFDFVLGISLVLDQRDPIDKFFMIPTKDFNPCNFLVFAENDNSYSGYKLESQQVQDKMVALCENFS